MSCYLIFFLSAKPPFKWHTLVDCALINGPKIEFSNSKILWKLSYKNDGWLTSQTGVHSAVVCKLWKGFYKLKSIVFCQWIWNGVVSNSMQIVTFRTVFTEMHKLTHKSLGYSSLEVFENGFRICSSQSPCLLSLALLCSSNHTVR